MHGQYQWTKAVCVLGRSPLPGAVTWSLGNLVALMTEEAVHVVDAQAALERTWQPKVVARIGLEALPEAPEAEGPGCLGAREVSSRLQRAIAQHRPRSFVAVAWSPMGCGPGGSALLAVASSLGSVAVYALPAGVAAGAGPVEPALVFDLDAQLRANRAAAAKLRKRAAEARGQGNQEDWEFEQDLLLRQLDDGGEVLDGLVQYRRRVRARRVLAQPQEGEEHVAGAATSRVRVAGSMRERRRPRDCPPPWPGEEAPEEHPPAALARLSFCPTPLPAVPGGTQAALLCCSHGGSVFIWWLRYEPRECTCLAKVTPPQQSPEPEQTAGQQRARDLVTALAVSQLHVQAGEAVRRLTVVLGMSTGTVEARELLLELAEQPRELVAAVVRHGEVRELCGQSDTPVSSLAVASELPTVQGTAARQLVAAAHGVSVCAAVVGGDGAAQHFKSSSPAHGLPITALLIEGSPLASAFGCSPWTLRVAARSGS